MKNLIITQKVRYVFESPTEYKIEVIDPQLNVEEWEAKTGAVVVAKAKEVAAFNEKELKMCIRIGRITDRMGEPKAVPGEYKIIKSE